MRLPRSTSFAVTGALLSGLVAIVTAAAQTATAPPQRTPAEMAKALAETIERRTAKTQDGEVIFQSATAHDNIVELQFAVPDAAIFARAKANAEGQRKRAAGFICDPKQISMLNGGVVIHEVLIAPGNRDRFEYSIDRSTCAALAASQPAEGPTVAELAKTIAGAIEEGLPKTPNPLLTFVSATAHDNIVEVRFTARDRERFAIAKVNPDMQRTAMAHIYCRDDPAAPLNRGVVIHQVIIGPDGHDQIEFNVDRAGCAALAPSPKPADAKTLAATAQAVALDIEADEHSPVPKTPRKKRSFRLDTATAHDSIVEVRVVVSDLKTGQGLKRNQSVLVYLFRKHYCMAYGDAMKQGVSVHPAFRMDDGTALLDFTIDQSSCQAPD